MEKLMIRVGKIRYYSKESKFTVFTADVLRKKKNGTFVPTARQELFIGKFFSIYPGDRFSIAAEPHESQRYGKELRVVSYHREMPGTLEELRHFLRNLRGVGPSTVKRILDTYQLDTLSVIQNDPQALTAIGLSKACSDKIRAELSANAYFEEILTFLQLNDLDYRYAMPIYQGYGEFAVSVMRDTPYKPYYKGIFPFSIADHLHHQMGRSELDPIRIEAGLLAYLQEDSQSNGNLFTTKDGLELKVSTFLNQKKSGHSTVLLSKAQIEQAADQLSKSRSIKISEMNGQVDYYLSNDYWSETQIVQDLHRITSSIKTSFYNLPEINGYLDSIPGLSLAPAQRQAVITAMTSSISIITGGPGTGKTQTLNTLLGAIRYLSPKATFRICAPTGRAALRITELTQMKAATIHRTLHFGGRSDKILKEEELICDFLIVDEFSMVDCSLCALLFRAITSSARIVIVGDHEQLPSVGPGLVLRDLIDSGKIPVTRLTQIFRQGRGSSRISDNAQRIIQYDNAQPLSLRISRNPHEDFYFIDRDSVSAIQNTICHSIRKLISDYGLSTDHIRVLSPIHGTALGTDAMNQLLQSVFNPTGEIYEREDGQELRVGDPVVHIKNDYDLGVFNGESGTILALGYDPDKAVLVEYPGGLRVWYSDLQTSELTLGYCSTVHKAQGGEFKVIIMPIHESISLSMTRNLLYTGITRAKQMVLFVGSKQAFVNSLRRNQIDQRNSNLVSRLQAI